VPLVEPTVELGAVRLGRYLVGGHRVGDWTVTLVLAPVRGQAGICEVHVEPFEKAARDGYSDDSIAWSRRILERFGHLADAALPTQTLTVVGLRGLPLGTLASATWETDRQTAEMSNAQPGATMTAGSSGSWSQVVSESGDATRAVTANRYVELVQSGHPRPLRQLADEFGVSVSAIRARIAKARSDGFLTDARNGVAGGELTELGQAHLDGLTD
jgi:hypothetical protein